MEKLRHASIALVLGMAVAPILGAAPPPEPAYIKLEDGTWAVGGVRDLTGPDRALLFVAERCRANASSARVNIGLRFGAPPERLALAMTIDAPARCGATLGLRDRFSGKCAVQNEDDLEKARVHFALSVDAEKNIDPATGEAELCLAVRCPCDGPPPTDKDAVSVQELTIGPPPV